jgi:hypothetical protein
MVCAARVRPNYEYATRLGCDSADGTLLAFAPSKKVPRLTGWVQRAAMRGELAA